MTGKDHLKAMIDALEPYVDVPFAFLGHCWSALAAYEATTRETTTQHFESQPGR